MTTKIKYILLFALASMVIIACSKDKLDEDSLACPDPIDYQDVRVLVSNSCGYSGCHNGIDRGENYNNFAGLESFLISGNFSSRVLSARDMPPSNASGVTFLTDEEIDLLRCWEQNDFSEF